MTRIWDTGSAARAGLREVAHLSKLQRELARSTPAAAARLRLVTDAATVAVLEIVTAIGRGERG